LQGEAYRVNSEERRRLILTGKEDAGYPARLWAKDEWREFAVFRVPVDALLLNIDNRRFAAERVKFEEELGRSLDPENIPGDVLSVASILLDSGPHLENGIVIGTPSKDYLSLKSDWLARKQEAPFWIRPDGTVRNGNRRLAMLLRLRDELGRDGFERVDAVILDDGDVSEEELFDMEQREQLTENFKVQYTDINRLLALRDAAIAAALDWGDPADVDRVAGLLQPIAGEGDRQYAVIQLNAIRAMDAYLRDQHQEGQYHKLLRQVERFRDIGKIISRMETDYAEQLPDVLRVAFAGIRAGAPHGEIRAIRKIFLEDRPRFDQLLDDINEREEPWLDDAGELGEPDLEALAEADNDDEGEVEVPGPVVPNYPIEPVRTLIKNAIDGFAAASNDDVWAVLDQTLNRLTSLTDERRRLESSLQGVGADAIRDQLRAIVEWSDEARHLLD
jgi:hypothetical protein